MRTVADHVFISVFPQWQRSYPQVSKLWLASRIGNRAPRNVCSCTMRAYKCGLCVRHKQTGKIKSKASGVTSLISWLSNWNNMRACGHVIWYKTANHTLRVHTWCTLIADKKCVSLGLPALLFLASHSPCVILCDDGTPSETPDWVRLGPATRLTSAIWGN